MLQICVKSEGDGNEVSETGAYRNIGEGKIVSGSGNTITINENSSNVVVLTQSDPYLDRHRTYPGDISQTIQSLEEVGLLAGQHRGNGRRKTSVQFNLAKSCSDVSAPENEQLLPGRRKGSLPVNINGQSLQGLQARYIDSSSDSETYKDSPIDSSESKLRKRRHKTPTIPFQKSNENTVVGLNHQKLSESSLNSGYTGSMHGSENSEGMMVCPFCRGTGRYSKNVVASLINRTLTDSQRTVDSYQSSQRSKSRKSSKSSKSSSRKNKNSYQGSLTSGSPSGSSYRSRYDRSQELGSQGAVSKVTFENKNFSSSSMSTDNARQNNPSYHRPSKCFDSTSCSSDQRVCNDPDVVSNQERKLSTKPYDLEKHTQWLMAPHTRYDENCGSKYDSLSDSEIETSFHLVAREYFGRYFWRNQQVQDRQAKLKAADQQLNNEPTTDFRYRANLGGPIDRLCYEGHKRLTSHKNDNSKNQGNEKHKVGVQRSNEMDWHRDRRFYTLHENSNDVQETNQIETSQTSKDYQKEIDQDLKRHSNSERVEGIDGPVYPHWNRSHLNTSRQEGRHQYQQFTAPAIRRPNDLPVKAENVIAQCKEDRIVIESQSSDSKPEYTVHKKIEIQRKTLSITTDTETIDEENQKKEENKLLHRQNQVESPTSASNSKFN